MTIYGHIFFAGFGYVFVYGGYIFDSVCSIIGFSWPLFGPPWPSPGLPGLQFNSLDPRESGLDPISTNFRPKISP